MSRHLASLLSLLTLTATVGLLACTQEAEPVDGRDDTFASGGKTDTGGIADGSYEATLVLGLVNTASAETLREAPPYGVGLATPAVDNLIFFRLGDDGLAGTLDDGHFATLATLDAIPFIGPIAFHKLRDFALATASSGPDLSWPGNRPDGGQPGYGNGNGDGGTSQAGGRVRFSWFIQRGTSTVECSSVGGYTVKLTVTGKASSTSTTTLFPCADFLGETAALPADTYVGTAQLLDATGDVLGADFFDPTWLGNGHDIFPSFQFDFPL